MVRLGGPKRQPSTQSGMPKTRFNSLRKVGHLFSIPSTGNMSASTTQIAEEDDGDRSSSIEDGADEAFFHTPENSESNEDKFQDCPSSYPTWKETRNSSPNMSRWSFMPGTMNTVIDGNQSDDNSSKEGELYLEAEDDDDKKNRLPKKKTPKSKKKKVSQSALPGVVEAGEDSEISSLAEDPKATKNTTASEVKSKKPSKRKSSKSKSDNGVVDAISGVKDGDATTPKSKKKKKKRSSEKGLSDSSSSFELPRKKRVEGLKKSNSEGSIRTNSSSLDGTTSLDSETPKTKARKKKSKSLITTETGTPVTITPKRKSSKKAKAETPSTKDKKTPGKKKKKLTESSAEASLKSSTSTSTTPKSSPAKKKKNKMTPSKKTKKKKKSVDAATEDTHQDPQTTVAQSPPAPPAESPSTSSNSKGSPSRTPRNELSTFPIGLPQSIPFEDSFVAKEEAGAMPIDPGQKGEATTSKSMDAPGQDAESKEVKSAVPNDNEKSAALSVKASTIELSQPSLVAHKGEDEDSDEEVAALRARAAVRREAVSRRRLASTSASDDDVKTGRAESTSSIINKIGVVEFNSEQERNLQGKTEGRRRRQKRSELPVNQQINRGGQMVRNMSTDSGLYIESDSVESEDLNHDHSGDDGSLSASDVSGDALDASRSSPRRKISPTFQRDPVHVHVEDDDPLSDGSIEEYDMPLQNEDEEPGRKPRMIRRNASMGDSSGVDDSSVKSNMTNVSMDGWSLDEEEVARDAFHVHASTFLGDGSDDELDVDLNADSNDEAENGGQRFSMAWKQPQRTFQKRGMPRMSLAATLANKSPGQGNQRMSVAASLGRNSRFGQSFANSVKLNESFAAGNTSMFMGANMNLQHREAKMGQPSLSENIAKMIDQEFMDEDFLDALEDIDDENSDAEEILPEKPKDREDLVASLEKYEHILIEEHQALEKEREQFGFERESIELQLEEQTQTNELLRDEISELKVKVQLHGGATHDNAEELAELTDKLTTLERELGRARLDSMNKDKIIDGLQEKIEKLKEEDAKKAVIENIVVIPGEDKPKERLHGEILQATLKLKDYEKKVKGQAAKIEDLTEEIAILKKKVYNQKSSSLAQQFKEFKSIVKGDFEEDTTLELFELREANESLTDELQLLRAQTDHRIQKQHDMISDLEETVEALESERSRRPATGQSTEMMQKQLAKAWSMISEKDRIIKNQRDMLSKLKDETVGVFDFDRDVENAQEPTRGRFPGKVDSKDSAEEKKSEHVEDLEQTAIVNKANQNDDSFELDDGDSDTDSDYEHSVTAHSSARGSNDPVEAEVGMFLPHSSSDIESEFGGMSNDNGSSSSQSIDTDEDSISDDDHVEVATPPPPPAADYLLTPIQEHAEEEVEKDALPKDLELEHLSLEEVDIHASEDGNVAQDSDTRDDSDVESSDFEDSGMEEESESDNDDSQDITPDGETADSPLSKKGEDDKDNVEIQESGMTPLQRLRKRFSAVPEQTNEVDQVPLQSAESSSEPTKDNDVSSKMSKCSACQKDKEVTEFSKSQLKKPASSRRCKTCIAQEAKEMNDIFFS